MELNKIISVTKKLNLLSPQWYKDILDKNPEIIYKIQNGVGSETHWSYHLIPDTIYFLNIIPSSSIHDLMYTFPLKFNLVADGLAWKRLADHYFYLNVLTQINNYGGIFKKLRKSRLNKYTFFLNASGSDSFWANKKLPPDFFDYYCDQPVYNNAKYYKLENTEKEIKKLCDYY